MFCCCTERVEPVLGLSKTARVTCEGLRPASRRTSKLMAMAQSRASVAAWLPLVMWSGRMSSMRPSPNSTLCACSAIHLIMLSQVVSTTEVHPHTAGDLERYEAASLCATTSGGRTAYCQVQAGS